MLIGDLSRACDCPAETIRYYERVGLLPAARRRRNGYREYDTSHLKYLRFILRAKRLGFTQDEVRQLVILARQKGGSCSKVLAIIEQQHVEVHKRIAELQGIEKALSRLKRNCCKKGEFRDCPVIDELMGSAIELAR